MRKAWLILPAIFAASLLAYFQIEKRVHSFNPPTPQALSPPEDISGAIKTWRHKAWLILPAIFVASLLAYFQGPLSHIEASPNRLTCTGYAEPRQFVEAQSWWTPREGQSGDNFGHVHAGACAPEREVLSADSALDVRFVLFENPGEVTYVAIVYKGTDYEDSYSFDPGWTCERSSCEFWHSFPIEMDKFKQSGLQELRIRATVREPDGNEERVSLNFQLYVDNGRQQDDVTRFPFLRGKGWYTGLNYAEADILSELPDSPVSGLFEPVIQMVNHANSAPLTGYSVRIDPNVHQGLPGTILLEGEGQLPQTKLRIDTSTLADGPHKLFLRADSRDDERDSTNAGILVLTFEVDNGAESTPTATSTLPPATEAPDPTATSTPSPTVEPDPTATSTPSPTVEPDPTATSTPAPGGDTITLRPVADTYFSSDEPETSFGLSSELMVDMRPTQEVAMKFDLSGVEGTVQSARLRVFVDSHTQDGPTIYLTGGSWDEASTWEDRPAPGRQVGDVGRMQKGWYEIPLTPFFSGPDHYSFLLVPESRNGLAIRSREAASGTVELILELTN